MRLSTAKAVARWGLIAQGTVLAAVAEWQFFGPGNLTGASVQAACAVASFIFAWLLPSIMNRSGPK